MKRINLSRIGPIAIVVGLLGSLAVGAPSFNTHHTAPRSVFLTLPADLPDPEIAMAVSQDDTGRWSLRLDVSSFQFTALCVTDAEAVPVGHAHIIHDGVKIASAYHPIVDLGHLPSGRHRIAVVLRGQDHRALLGQSGLLRQEIVVTVPKQAHVVR